MKSSKASLYTVGKKIGNYELKRKIGEGSTSQVYLSINQNKKQFAVKVIQKDILKKDKYMKKLIRTEIEVLKACDNPNVVKLFQVIQKNNCLYLVTEYCNQGDMEQFIKKNKKIQEKLAIKYLTQILRGFKGLHQNGAMHRDFKLSNILMHNGRCKICDLGFAKQVEQHKKHYRQTQTVKDGHVSCQVIGTAITMAPEILEGKPYGFEADIWSLGVCFYKLLYGQQPYIANNDYNILLKIRSQRPYFDQNVQVSDQAKDFIEKCLTVDPKQRIKWKQIYEHPLLKQKKQKSTPQILMTPVKNTAKTQLDCPSPSPLGNSIDIKQLKDYYKNQLMLRPAPKQLLQDTIDEETPQQQQKLSAQKLKELQDARFNNYIKKYRQCLSNKNYSYHYIYQLTQPLSNLHINHHIPCFLLMKQTYFNLKQFHEKIVSDINIQEIETQDFNNFIRTNRYRSLKKQVEQKMKKIKLACQNSINQISLCTHQIIKQFDLSKIHNSKFKNLIHEILGEYEKVLIQCIWQSAGKRREYLLKIIYAVKYYRENETVKTEEFKNKLQNVNVENIQEQIMSQYDKLDYLQN